MITTCLLLPCIFLLFVDKKSQLEAFNAYFQLARSRGHFRRPSLAFSNEIIDFKPIYDPFVLSHSELRSDISYNSGSEEIRAFLMNQLEIMLSASSSSVADLYFMQNWGDSYSDSEFHDLSRFYHCEDPSKVSVDIEYETPIDPDTFYRLASSCCSNNKMCLSTLPVVYQNGNELFVSLILENRLYGIVRLYRCPFSGVNSWDNDFKSIDLVVRICQGVLKFLEKNKDSTNEAEWIDHMDSILNAAQATRTYSKMLLQRLPAQDKIGQELIENIIVQMDALQDKMQTRVSSLNSENPTFFPTAVFEPSPKPEIALKSELFKNSKTETMIDLSTPNETTIYSQDGSQNNT